VSRKRIFLWVAIAGAAAAAAQWLPLPLQPSDAARQVLAQAPRGDGRADGASAEGRWAALPKRETLGEPAGQLFFPHSWAPPVRPEVVAVAPAAVSKPAAPPMPYRVAGKVLHEGPPQIVLAKGDSIVTAREGDTLDDGYRVEAIRRDHVTLIYVPLGAREQLPVTSTFVIDEPLADALPEPAREPQAAATAPDAASAQFRWAGPPQVKAGDPFSVALRLSSGQAVRAVPLQLSYDAALLEAVDVRPGKFFMNGLFTYRINPEGSIVVGASGKDSVASDAELVILTFKPIRAGATAELKISSMILQSAAGSAIVHHEPDPFRTAIAP
jgi:hypothetical protein